MLEQIVNMLTCRMRLRLLHRCHQLSLLDIKFLPLPYQHAIGIDLVVSPKILIQVPYPYQNSYSSFLYLSSHQLGLFWIMCVYIVYTVNYVCMYHIHDCLSTCCIERTTRIQAPAGLCKLSSEYCNRNKVPDVTCIL